MKPHRSNAAISRPKTNSIRALLVDDSPLMLQALKGFLARDHRFQVVGTAADGRQAVLDAAALTPQLVLVDLHLPHLNGAEVTRCLKQFDSPPVVFMITSDDTIAARALCAAAGADVFLIKSGDLTRQLESKIQEWFGPNHSPRPASGAAPPSSSPSLAAPNLPPAR
jgi:DNA-binding NarL/FixJ family response regulator